MIIHILALNAFEIYIQEFYDPSFLFCDLYVRQLSFPGFLLVGSFLWCRGSLAAGRGRAGWGPVLDSGERPWGTQSIWWPPAHGCAVCCQVSRKWALVAKALVVVNGKDYCSRFLFYDGIYCGIGTRCMSPLLVPFCLFGSHTDGLTGIVTLEFGVTVKLWKLPYIPSLEYLNIVFWRG